MATPGQEPGLRHGTRWSIGLGPAASAGGAGLAWGNVWAAFLCYGAIGLYFVLPHAVRARAGR